MVPFVPRNQKSSKVGRFVIIAYTTAGPQSSSDGRLAREEKGASTAKGGELIASQKIIEAKILLVPRRIRLVMGLDKTLKGPTSSRLLSRMSLLKPPW